MKKNKLITIFCVIFSCFLTACFFLPKDYVPEILGEWEGNYIYYNNYRMKTSGGEYEKLIDGVEIDGYYYDYVELDGRRQDEILITSTFYNKDDVYLCVIYGQNQNCLVKYNLLEKTHKILYRAQDYQNYAVVIRILRDNVIVVANGFYTTSQYFIIDYEGNILQSNANEYREYEFFGDYIVNVSLGKIECRHWDENDFKIVLRDSSINKDNTWIFSENNILYITKHFYKRKEGFVEVHKEQSLYLYDMQNSVFQTVFEASGMKSISFVTLNHEYYFIYESKEAYADGFNIYAKANCVLYKINSDLTSTKIYEFDKNKDYTKAIYRDGYLNITVTWIEKRKTQYDSCFLDLQTLKLNKGEYKSTKSAKLDLSFVYGDYYYYQTESRNYYYLHRRNLKTNLTEIIQYSEKQNIKDIFGYNNFEYKDIDAIRSY